MKLVLEMWKSLDVFRAFFHSTWPIFGLDMAIFSWDMAIFPTCLQVRDEMEKGGKKVIFWPLFYKFLKTEP